MGTFYDFYIETGDFKTAGTNIWRNGYPIDGFIVNACYSIDFLSYGQSGQLSFLHKLKNNWLKNSDDDLFKSKDEAVSKIYNFLMDLNNYSMKCNKGDPLAHHFLKDYDFRTERVLFAEKGILVCRVPRSKVNMQDSQLLFQAAIREAIELVNDEWSVHNKEHNTNYKLIDGIDCIKRIKDVPTTHLTGDKAYPGITEDSCFISDKIEGETILLIDDIYTLGVGVVEDCIQTLYKLGAWEVIFYAVGRTVKKTNREATKIQV